jgi:TPR repeat protein
VSQDYKLAMEWYQKAASNGNIDAQYNIGYLYQYGLGVSPDYKQAMKWFQKAAGNGIAEAIYSIGGLYENGRGVTKSVDIAIEWYQKAANNNHEGAKVTLERLNKQRSNTKEEHKGSIYLCLFYNGS